MNKLILDSAEVEISKRVLDILRALIINNWQSEPYFQHQNYADHCWQELKKYTNWIMDITGAPKDVWLLCLEYVADILNLIYNESIKTIPLQKLSGQTQDCSILLLFKFWQLVYISQHETKFLSSNKIKRRFAGFSKHVGHHFTYKVLIDETKRNSLSILVTTGQDNGTDKSWTIAQWLMHQRFKTNR